MSHFTIRSNIENREFSEWTNSHPETSLLVSTLAHKFPKEVSGVDAVRQMRREGSRNYRQMEWVGFYLEHFVSMDLDVSRLVNDDFRNLSRNTKFDLFLDGVDGDLKSHTNTSPRGIVNKNVQLNDKEAVDLSVQSNGEAIFIILNGDASYDVDGTYRQKLREAAGVEQDSEYTKKVRKEGRSSRARKMSFKATGITLLSITEHNISSVLWEIGQGRNSNGSPRPMKYLFQNTEHNLHEVSLDI